MQVNMMPHIPIFHPCLEIWKDCRLCLLMQELMMNYTMMESNFFSKQRKPEWMPHSGPAQAMVHCYPLLAPMFREATEAMEEIVGFIHQQLQTASYKL
jgi:hypothetical protein